LFLITGPMNNPRENPTELEEFKALYNTYAPQLIYYAAKYVDPVTTEDLVQDVFFKIWQKKIFHYIKEGISHYLYRSVQHTCLDYLKHKEITGNYRETILTQLKIEEIRFNDDPSFLFAEDRRLSAIYHEIEKLPERCREIFTMSYLEERKTTEIASLLDISKRTVEAQLYKALKQLRGALLKRNQHPDK